MPTVNFGWYEFVVSHKVSSYRNLLELVDQQLEGDLAELEQEALKIASQQQEDGLGRDEYREHLYEEYFEREEYKAIFLQALFASSFALFEHELVRVCEWARKETENPFSVKDFGGRDYMENVKKYLKKLGLDFPANTSEWQKATEYRTIRNKIVHQGGALGENDIIIGFARRNGILGETALTDGDKEFHLQLTRAFCDKVLNDFLKVLTEVNSAYEQWLQVRTL